MPQLKQTTRVIVLITEAKASLQPKVMIHPMCMEFIKDCHQVSQSNIDSRD